VFWQKAGKEELQRRAAAAILHLVLARQNIAEAMAIHCQIQRVNLLAVEGAGRQQVTFQMDIRAGLAFLLVQPEAQAVAVFEATERIPLILTQLKAAKTLTMFKPRMVFLAA
jgi:hypothetical protein